MTATTVTSRLLPGLAAVAAAILLLSAAVLAAIHLDDLYAAHQAPGIWLALARSANEGILYPPLQDDGFYAGTRYTPLFFLLVAGLDRMTGNGLLAVKLAAILSVSLLGAAVLVMSRRLTGRWLDAVGLTGVLLALPQGLNALLMPHADALAAALSLWGLVAVAWAEGRPGRIVWAGICFALAPAVKFSTVAGCGAALVWLLLRSWRQALSLLLLSIVLGLSWFLLVDWLSAGRFLTNLRALGSGGLTPDTILRGPQLLLHNFQFTQGFALLLPLAGCVLLLRLTGRRWQLWDWNLLTTLATTLIVYTSPGTADNHLLELEVAVLMVIASLLGEQPAPASGLATLLQPSARFFIAATLLLGLGPHLATWRAGAAQGAIPLNAITAELPASARLLTETPTVPVLLGQRPVVMDAFCFRVLAERRLIDDAALAERIRRHEFNVVILLGRIDVPGETFCPDIHFGPRVTDAILQEYRFDRRIGLFYLFVRKESSCCLSFPQAPSNDVWSLAHLGHHPQPQPAHRVAEQRLLAVARKGHALHPVVRSTLSATHLGAVNAIPDPDDPILRLILAAGRQDVLAVRAKGDAHHGVGVTTEPADLFLRANLPQTQDAVITPRDDVLAVRTECHRVDCSRVSIPAGA
jgi:hypothetical protein